MRVSQSPVTENNIKMFPLLIVHLFLSRYVGEIIPEAEAEMRQNDAYLFSLDDKVKHKELVEQFAERWS